MWFVSCKCWSWTPLVLLLQKQQQRNNIRSSQSRSWWLVMYLLRPCGPICVTDKQHEPWSVSVSSGMGIKTFSTACGSCSRSISGETWTQTAPDSIQIFPNLRGFLKISSCVLQVNMSLVIRLLSSPISGSVLQHCHLLDCTYTCEHIWIFKEFQCRVCLLNIVHFSY